MKVYSKGKSRSTILSSEIEQMNSEVSILTHNIMSWILICVPAGTKTEHTKTCQLGLVLL